MGLLGLAFLLKPKTADQPTQTGQQDIVAAFLALLQKGQATIPEIKPAPQPNTPNTPAIVTQPIIPPLYAKAAQQLGINPLDIYDISIPGDNTQLLVRMKDGRVLTTSNPEYIPPANTNTPKYVIKYDQTEKWSKDGLWNQNPTILDTGGFNNIGTGSPDFDKIYGAYPIKRSNGQPVTSFLEYTKDRWGNSTDILGLQGYAAYAESIAHVKPFVVVYEGQTPITAPQPGQTGTATPYTPKPTDSPTVRTIYSGGTVINTPAPTVICSPDANGNMQCRPK